MVFGQFGIRHHPAPKPVKGTVYVDEDSVSGSRSSDTRLELIKTLHEKGVQVTMDRSKADFVVSATRKTGREFWAKDSKVVLSDRQNSVVWSGSARSIGGIADQVTRYLRGREE